MVVDIQEKLRDVFLHQDNIPDKIIFLEELSEAEFNTAPWISILPDSATIEGAWQNVVGNVKKNDITYNVRQKYKVTQPITIRMVFEDKRELDKVTDCFLVDLPKSIPLEDVTVEVIPQNIERIFAKGQLDISVAVITLSAEYPIVKLIEKNKKIPSITINTK